MPLQDGFCSTSVRARDVVARRDVCVGGSLEVKQDVSASAVHAETVNAAALTLDGMSAYTLNNVAFNGVVRNFPTGGAASIRYAEFGGHSGSTNENAIVIPFDAIVVAFSINYIHGSDPISVDPGEGVAFTVGRFDDPPAQPVTFAPFLGTTLSVTHSPDDGTWPGKFVTAAPNDVAVGLGTVPRGSRLAVCAQETGTVTPTNADIIVSVVLRPTSPIGSMP